VLFSLGFVEIIVLSQKSIHKGVFLANQLASTDNLTRTSCVGDHHNMPLPRQVASEQAARCR